MNLLWLRNRRAFLAVILFLTFAFAGLVRQSALLVEIESPRIRAIGSLLLDQIAKTRSMDSRSPLALLVSQLWLSDQDIGWLRIEIDDGKLPISRGSDDVFGKLPSSWRNGCHRAARFDTRMEVGNSTMMAGAPASQGEPAFCVFIGYNFDAAVTVLRKVIYQEALLLLLVSIVLFGIWRTASTRVGVLAFTAAVFSVSLVNYFVLQGLVAQQIEGEAQRTARLAAIDFQIALQEAPLSTLKNVETIKDSMQEFLSRDPLVKGMGVQIGEHFQHWEWQQGEQLTDRMKYGKEPLRVPAEGGEKGEVFVAFSDSLNHTTLLHSMSWVIMLGVVAFACSSFLVDATTSSTKEEKPKEVLPILGASFFFILAEELLRPALLPKMHQQISGLPQEATLWFGLNLFWLCALWGTWTSYRWFQLIPTSRLLASSSFVMAVCLVGQGYIGNALYWLPLRGIEGYVFGLGLQSGIVFASRVKDSKVRFTLLSQMAQGALVATVVGPIVGGALTRVGGTTAAFYLAAGAAAIAAFLVSRIPADKPDGNAQSALTAFMYRESRHLAIPLLAMGVANRFVWFCAVGLLLPSIANSQPLGAAVVGELIGLLGLGMYVGRRGIDRWSIAAHPQMGWAANAVAAFVLGAGYAADISVWAWMPVAFIVGAALTAGSRAQLDWILAQSTQYSTTLHGVSRLADRGGALLAGVIIPPLYVSSHHLVPLVLVFTVIALWITSHVSLGRHLLPQH